MDISSIASCLEGHFLLAFFDDELVSPPLPSPPPGTKSFTAGEMQLVSLPLSKLCFHYHNIRDLSLIFMTLSLPHWSHVYLDYHNISNLALVFGGLIGVPLTACRY